LAEHGSSNKPLEKHVILRLAGNGEDETEAGARDASWFASLMQIMFTDDRARTFLQAAPPHT